MDYHTRDQWYLVKRLLFSNLFPIFFAFMLNKVMNNIIHLFCHTDMTFPLGIIPKKVYTLKFLIHDTRMPARISTTLYNSANCARKCLLFTLLQLSITKET